MAEKKYDVVVIGAGSGLLISSEAARRGLKTAVIEQGPFGGTCLNRGCIPSKMLIHSADVMETVQKAKDFGIAAKVTGVNWKQIVSRATRTVETEARQILQGNKSAKNITVYRDTAKFVGMKKMKVGKDTLVADNIFICAGTRPSAPPIPGLESVKYITSDEALRLQKQPKSLVIIGGGYIASELAHFFGALGTKVTILQRSDKLLTNEDSEIAAAFTKAFAKKHAIVLNANTQRVFRKGKDIAVEYTVGNRKQTVVGEQLLVATGRVPNTDILDVAKTGLVTFKPGFVKTNEFMETNVQGIWAIGDIAGVYLFKHSANLEAEHAAHNAFNPNGKVAVPYFAMPHAVFSSPQIGSVGMTEDELKAKRIPYAVGRYAFHKVAYGHSIEDRDGFVKVLADPKTRQIFGCHILGTDAATLIHEVIVAMKHNLAVDDVVNTVHVHPALPEVIQRAFASVEFP
jgi:dihydrolipoamide dehydrogenase